MRRALRLLIGVSALLCAASGAAPADGLGAARQRGELVVGVPYLAPAPEAGAKIRTPEGLDHAMAEKLAQELGVPFRLRQVAVADAARLLAAGDVDVVLADRAQPAPGLPSELATVATGYAARPKAIIRSDTRMRQGGDARGRSVCMAEAAVGAQALAHSWGAVVRIYRVPSDALVAVREGSCDIGLIDDVVWEPLMRFPEWKKFSATLAADGARHERVWLLPAADTAGQAWLAERMREWARAGAWKALPAKWARDVAFDVYLDQEVADCHG